LTVRVALERVKSRSEIFSMNLANSQKCFVSTMSSIVDDGTARGGKARIS
jgi:hypothetical protein